MKTQLWVSWAALSVGLWSTGKAGAQNAPSPQDAAQAAPPAQAAQGTNELADLELEELMRVPVVVTASRREESATALPYAVSVITAADIRAAGARTVPDALRLAAGVDVAHLSYAQYAVGPRGPFGLLTRRVLVLVDGRQIYDSVTGGNYWGDWPFLVEDIERIEVVRGPVGVVWGANALSGVINIISKDPAEQSGATLLLNGASRGSHKEYLGYGGKDGKLRLRMSSAYEDTDGFKNWRSPLFPGDDDYRVGRGSMYAVYEANDKERLTVSAGSSVSDGGFPVAPISIGGPKINPSSQSNFLLGRWSYRDSPQSEYLWTAYVNDFFIQPGVPQIDYRYQQIAVQFSRSLSAAERHRLTWGVDSRTDLLDTTNADPQMLERDFVSSANVNAYVQDDWRLAPKWTLGMGAGLTYDFYGGFESSARLSLLRELDKDAHVYAAVSRAFQMAPVGARFLKTPFFGGLLWIEGSRGIDPLTLMAYEIGHRRRFFDRLDLRTALYWHDHQDYTTLSPRLGPPGLVTLDFDNRAALNTYGLEWEGTYAVTSRLQLSANYTYQQMEWRSSTQFHEAEEASPPKHKFMVGARWNASDRFRLSTNLYYTDAYKSPNAFLPYFMRHMDPYFHLDLRAEYDVKKDRATLAVGVRNLLDDHHPEGGTFFINPPEVPRMIYMECRIRIPR